MKKTVDVFWSFRSPYSYLATPGMLELARDFDVEVALRVVLPAAIRSPEMLFTPQNAIRARYIKLDFPRRARFLGMPDKWPRPDPIVQDMKTLKIADEQPYIDRLSRLGVEAQRRGRGLAFAYEISHLLFGGTRDWHLGEHLAQASARAGLDLAELDAAIANGDHADDIARNQQALADADHWGVPTFVFEGEPFFGQDRLDTLRWHLTNVGLART
ncbi:MAG: DsbA family protein [Burkholderiaceae bacterium]